MMRKTRKVQSLVVYLDVYGFRPLIGALDNLDLSEKLTQGHESILAILQNNQLGSRSHSNKLHKPPYVYVFSDSIAISYPTKDPRDRILLAKKCVGDIRRILDAFVRLGMPLRGGIGFGEVTCGKNMLIGEPLVRAYEDEQRIDAPLVLLQEKEITNGLPEGSRGAVSDLQFGMVHMKNNEMTRGCVILPRQMNTFMDLISQKIEESLENRKYSVVTAWSNALYYVDQYSTRLKTSEKKLLGG
jgi:hypothetical protein